MLHVDRIADLRAACEDARAQGSGLTGGRGKRVGIVPTMGFLHDGHRSLMRAARANTDFVVVTIFVNPLQFGAHEDLDRYPRDLAGDLDQCRAEGVDCVFSPSVAEMYPRPPLTTVGVTELTAELCGAARPGHFDGVTTVVAKLFAIVGPCAAFFGRKDAQQLAVVTRMADDLNLPVEVVGCPIVREPDGLAMSSRNAYLSPQEREAALVLSAALRGAVDAIIAGERDSSRVAHLVREVISAERAVALEYAEVRDAHELTRIPVIDGSVLIAVAARVGATRLIDNTLVRVDDTGVTADLGVERAATSGNPVVRTTPAHDALPEPSPAPRLTPVRRTMMKSKIHRATVTGADVDYVGSITLDPELMRLADMREFEQVHVLDIDNGARFETYAMKGSAGDVILNGAAARLVQPGDRVIVITYADYDEVALASYEPQIVHVDEHNRAIPEEEAVRRAGSNLVWMRTGSEAGAGNALLDHDSVRPAP